MAKMTPAQRQQLLADLHSSRERLCRAQTWVQHASHRQWLQEALNSIDRIGVFEFPDIWSRFDEPPMPEVV